MSVIRVANTGKIAAFDKDNCEICGKPTTKRYNGDQCDIEGIPYSCTICSDACYRAYLKRYDYLMQGSKSPTKQKCSSCDGTGKIKGYRCCRCDGEGKL